jgi:hypothetical protein
MRPSFVNSTSYVRITYLRVYSLYKQVREIRMTCSLSLYLSLSCLSVSPRIENHAIPKIITPMETFTKDASFQGSEQSY